jgi:hypothetical protein
MTQHFTRLTVSAAFYCGKCGKQTQHRIDNGRKGPCLECIARYDNAPKVAKPEEKQEELFR